MSDNVPVGRIRARTLETVVARVSAHALGVIASVLIARALGPSGRGAYVLPVTIGTIAYYAGNLGTEQAQFRLWSLRSFAGGAFVTSSWLFAGALGGLAVGATWLTYALLADSSLADVSSGDLMLALAVIPIQMHLLLVSSLLLLDGALRRVNMALLVGAAVHTGISIFLYLGDWLTVRRVLLLYILNFLAPWLIMLPRLRAVGHLRWPPQWELVRRQLSTGLRVHPYMLTQYLNMRLDVLLVASIMDLRSVGLYSVALLFGELTWLFTNALGAAVSEHQGAGSDALVLDVTLRTARMATLSSSVGGAFISMAALPAIPFFFGSEFNDAYSVVWPLMAAGVGMALWRSIAPMMIRYAPPSLPSIIASVALLINLLGNIILIPRYGIVGAGVASVMSYWAGGLGCCWWMYRRYGTRVSEIAPGSAEVVAIAQSIGAMIGQIGIRSRITKSS